MSLPCSSTASGSGSLTQPEPSPLSSAGGAVRSPSSSAKRRVKPVGTSSRWYRIDAVAVTFRLIGSDALSAKAENESGDVISNGWSSRSGTANSRGTAIVARIVLLSTYVRCVAFGCHDESSPITSPPYSRPPSFGLTPISVAFVRKGMCSRSAARTTVDASPGDPIDGCQRGCGQQIGLAVYGVQKK